METYDLSAFTKDGIWPTPTQDTSMRTGKYPQGGKALSLSVSTSSAAASPASPSLLLGRDWPKPTTGGSGPSSHESFAHYDPASSSWRTSQVCLDGALATWSETWPRAG